MQNMQYVKHRHLEANFPYLIISLSIKVLCIWRMISFRVLSQLINLLEVFKCCSSHICLWHYEDCFTLFK